MARTGPAGLHLQNDLKPVKVEIGQSSGKNDYFKLGGSLHGSIHGRMTGSNLFDSNDIENFWRGVGFPMPTQSRCNDLLPGLETDQMHYVETPGAPIKHSDTMGLPGNVPLQPPLPPEWSHVTTVMMRNLPNKYTQRMLLTEVNQSGFLGTFDFFYLPIDQETSANRGYGFLNFIAPYYAWAFRNMFEGRRMSRFNSAKVVSVTPATLQGFQANYAHYSSARVNRGDPSARPLFLREPSPELLGKANDLVQGDQEKGNSKRRQRKGGKPQAAENTLKTPPKARLDKKAIDQNAGNHNQYQGSETTTTAQDSQESTESLESQESQSSHSDSRESQDDNTVTPVKSRQQSRSGNQQKSQQQNQQNQGNGRQQAGSRQSQRSQQQKQQDQHKKADQKADSATDAEPHFIDINNGSSVLSNGSYSSHNSFSGLSRSLGALNTSLSGYPPYPAQPDAVQYAGLNMGSIVSSQSWSSPEMSSRQNASLPGLSPVFGRGPAPSVNVGPTTGLNQQVDKPKARFCPHCAGCIKPQFQFCPHCGSGLAFLGQN
jgi:hypothetical protein